MNRTILVTGATGSQGGAVARSLLRDGWTVRALVRDPHAPAARALAARGAHLVTGDLDDAAALREAAAGAAGVFSVQPMPDADPDRGIRVADAAAAAGVGHLVYSSVAGAERSTGIPHFDTKARVEEHLRGLAATVTVLRPVFFMENWLGMLPRDGGEVAVPLSPHTRLPMIAVADIGRIAADAFAHPGAYAAGPCPLAGDELSVAEIAEAVTAVTGRPVRFTRRAIAELRATDDAAARMFDWIDREGFGTDVPALRRRHPGLLTFTEWLTGSRPPAVTG
ncbi:NmrA/HSCARG family protein [Nocardia thailandica]|uniref:NmrA/HSCARG family protein n=1 Tax=Nocardia thailandica TaxID=257275 RepID=UPI0002DC6B4B|nr:NmrA/HSCARG family protein [Nocardia thailandica]